jgi:hypothetical protein
VHQALEDDILGGPDDRPESADDLRDNTDDLTEATDNVRHASVLAGSARGPDLVLDEASAGGRGLEN